MSFWKSLFGWGKPRDDVAALAPLREVEHKGFLIVARPFLENGQYQLAGAIARVSGDDRQEHLWRADRFASKEAAIDAAIAKGRQLIDEQGERLFG